MQCHMAKLLARRDEWPMDCYGFTPYRNREAEAVFWGAYSHEFDIIEAHSGPGIIVWRGNDLYDHGHRTDIWQNFDLVATSRWHEQELTRLKLDYRRLNLPGRDLSDFTYTAAGDKILVYLGDDRSYGNHLLPEIRKRCPDEQFIIVEGWDQFTRSEMRAAMTDSWLHLRLREFDGPASTVLEMGMMGRRSVFNGDTPGAIPWADIDEVVTIIENAPRDADPQLPFALKDWITLDSEWF